MNILVLSPTLPYPPTDGGRIRVWNLLRHLAQEASIRLCALETTPIDRESMETLRAVGIEPVLVRQQRPTTPPLTLSACARAIVRRWPLTVARYALPAYRRQVEALLNDGPIDLVHLEMLPMAAWLKLVRRRTPAPVVWSTQNVDSDLWRRAAAHQPTPWQRWAVRWQAGVIRRMERRIANRVEGITAASERDAALYRQMAPQTPIATIDNGVDVEAYRPDPEVEEPATFVYTASYDWLPNADAVLYFCEAIWPKIRKRLPNARFLAVGKEPPLAMRRWDGRDGITITGRVPDVKPYIARAGVYVVPLRIGGGTRLKILEAMAMGKAIVSTAIGAEGLDVTPGQDLLIADDPGAFAAASVALVENGAQRRTLGESARRRVVQRYDWRPIAGRLLEFYGALQQAPHHREVSGWQ